MSALPAPVVLFCYNRPDHLRRTLDALARNPLAAQSTLIAYSDGPKSTPDEPNVRAVRKLLEGLAGFKSVEVAASTTNRGLADSVIQGVSEVLSAHGRAIVMEDDIVCTSDFLDYMNAALSVYQDRPDVFSVTGYSPPFQLPPDYREDVFLAPRSSSWGWGTWRDRWEKADWTLADFGTLKDDVDTKNYLDEGGDDLWPMLLKQQRGVIDSWSVRWSLAQSRHRAYGLYPVRSKVHNIGTDGTGANFTFRSTAYGRELAEGTVSFPPDLKPRPEVIDSFRRFYDLPWRVKVKNRVKFGI